MPTYEYECRRCGHRFEKFQAMKDRPLQRCPRCRGKIERLPGGGAGILFRGAGFYATDYRSAGYRKAARAEKSGETKKSAPAAESASKGDATKSKAVSSS